MADSEPDSGTTAHWQQAYGQGPQGQQRRGSGGRKLPWFIAGAVVTAGAVAAVVVLIPGGPLSPSSSATAYKLIAPPALDGIPADSAMTRNWAGLQGDFSCIASAMQTSGIGVVTSDVIKGYARTSGTTDTIPAILYYGFNGTFSSSVSHYLSTTKDCNFGGSAGNPAMQSASPGPHGGQLQVGSGDQSIVSMWSTATDVAVVAYQDPGSGTNPGSFCRQVRDSAEVPADA